MVRAATATPEGWDLAHYAGEDLLAAAAARLARPATHLERHGPHRTRSRPALPAAPTCSSAPATATAPGSVPTASPHPPGSSSTTRRARCYSSGHSLSPAWTIPPPPHHPRHLRRTDPPPSETLGPDTAVDMSPETIRRRVVERPRSAGLGGAVVVRRGGGAGGSGLAHGRDWGAVAVRLCLIVT